MDLPLLASKLAPPAVRPALLRRPRLESLLENAISGGLVLLSAPAGFGKTTLVADWLQRRPPTGPESPPSSPAAWLTLDDADNDPHRFWSYLIAAIQKARPGFGQGARTMLGAPQPVQPEAFVTLLLHEMAAQSAPPAIVLDELHWLRNESILGALQFLLEHWPAGWRGILITRIDPQIPLARLRAAGRLADIRVEDLRCTEEESGRYLREAEGLSIPEEDMRRLARRTEGWIAGLQMAVRSMRGSMDAAGFVREFAASPRFALDFLLEEVLQREPAEVQSFLLETSVLERLSAPLCDAVTGRTDSRRVIDRLSEADLFLTPLDAAGGWFRYHNLFAELLSRQLRRRPAADVSALHRRAGAWLAAAGDLEGAIRHALAAEDFARAADWIAQAAHGCLDRGEMETLRGWLAAVPEGMRLTRPWLCVFEAWLMLLGGQGEKLEQRLAAAERALETDGADESEAGRIRGYIATIRSQVALIRGDHPAAIRQANDALARLAPSDRNAISSAVTILGGAYSSMGDFQSGIALLERSRSMSRGGNPFNAIMSASALGQMSAVCGRLRDAHRLFLETLREGETMGGAVAGMGFGHLYFGLADLLREWNRLAEARAAVEKGLALSRPLGQAEILMPGYMVLARVQRAAGEFEAALATLDDARRLASELSAWSVGGVLAQQARIRLAMGDAGGAGRWVAESGLTPDSEASFAGEFGLLTLARWLIGQGRHADVDLLLDRLDRIAESGGRNGSRLEMRILRAVSRAHAGWDAEALSLLNAALHQAEPEGYARLFLDEGEPLIGLLRKAALAPGSPVRAYAARLVDAASPETHAPASPAHGPGQEPLSERELELFRLLAAGLSNAQMAERLSISLNTVKAHLKNIYMKLDAHNRTQAIARARERKIL